MRPLTFLAAVLAAGAASAATTPINQLSNGMTATISGKVDRITDEDEFVLSDASGSVLVYIGPGIVPFDVGERLTVNGIVDREMGRLEVYAREARRADGTVVTFEHRYE